MLDHSPKIGQDAKPPLLALARRPFVPTKEWRKLDFTMQDQHHSNWCWAAVAASVAHYYKHHAKPTQCAIVNQELERNDCCTSASGSSSLCNVPHVLGAPLYRLGCADNLGFEGQAKLADIQKEIDGSRPVCARVLWTTTEGRRGAAGAHFVTIVGYLPKTDMLAVEDSWIDPSLHEISYESFCNDYDGRGIWTHTYFTTSPPRNADR